MSDLPFGIEAPNTYASLSPADLQSLGKRACVAYLGSGISLNDAIVKIAREYPSISPHQVQRVIEYANQETFAKLFADNEKYASDKNIEFDVADPGYILLELNNGARPSVMTAPPDEYSSSPVKLAHSTVEADIELARVFGFDPALPGAEKTAYAQLSTKEDGSYVVERVLSTFSKSANANGDQFLDRILSAGESYYAKHADLMQGMAPQAAPMGQPPPQQQATVEDDGNSHNTQMLALQREIELSKKRQELQKVQQQTLDAMNPQGQPGAMTAPGPEAVGPATGEVGPDAGAAMGAQGAPAPADGGQAPQEQAPQLPQAAVGAITAPPGSEGIKMGSIVKEAVAYVKSGRPRADLVYQALNDSVSLDYIKEAAAAKGSYPMANPYGGVIREKQKIAKLLEDAVYARGKNQELYKEAAALFQKEVSKHLWDGGSFGEIAHLMSSVSEAPTDTKEALASVMPELIRQGLDPVKARAQAIAYEMEKGASARVPNRNHPIARAYADMLKLAEGTSILNASCDQLQELCQVADAALREGMVNASQI